MEKLVYIFASTKTWHKDIYSRKQNSYPGRCEYVASQEELEREVIFLKPRYVFFLHWNWLVPEHIWKNYECVCFHMTDVPYGRGGTPLQNLIVNSVEETMVSALRMDAELDAGPVYAKRPMSLEGRAEDIYLRAGEISWEMVRWIIEEEPTPQPQVGKVSLFRRRKPEQSELPSTGDLEKVYDHIRMLDAPTYPLAFVDQGEFRLELSHPEIQGEEVHANVVIRHINPKSKS